MSVTRREFLIAVPAAGAVLALLPRRSPQSPGGSGGLGRRGAEPRGTDAPRAAGAPGEPVVSFHLDQPYLDPTGLDKPYLPPAGLRSGTPLAALSEEQVFSRFYGFI